MRRVFVHRCGVVQSRLQCSCLAVLPGRVCALRPDGCVVHSVRLIQPLRPSFGLNMWKWMGMGRFPQGRLKVRGARLPVDVCSITVWAGRRESLCHGGVGDWLQQYVPAPVCLGVDGVMMRVVLYRRHPGG